MNYGSLVVGAKMASPSVPLIRHAVRTANGAPITVVHVRVPPTGWAACTTWSASALRMWADECESEIRTAALIALDAYDGPWRVVVRNGDPARELVALAEAERARAVILGESTPRRRPFKTVVEKVRSLTPRELVVVPDLATVDSGVFADLWFEASPESL